MKAPSEKIDPLVAQAAAFIDARGLLPPDSGVVVGVSGGADSVALLAVLRQLSAAQGRNWRLTAAHLNHGLRADADADARFVASLAEKWQLPCIVETRDAAAEARRSGCGLEEAGRELRYDFLQAVAARCQAARVAVGHHADDNVETVLHRICRGTHLRGLAGMPAARPLGRQDVLLVRPLLACRRQQIEAFCRRSGLQWRTDQTNVELRYRRNFIRHQLLPLLRREMNVRADEALMRLAAAAEKVERHLEQQAGLLLAGAQRPAESGIALDRNSLAGQDEVMLCYVVRLAMERLGVPLAGMAAERLEDLARLFDPTGPATLDLPGGFLARRQGELVVFAPAPCRPQPPAGSSVLQCPGRTELGDGREISCRIEPFDQTAFDDHCCRHRVGVEMLDADRLSGPLACRPRRDGDVFRPLGCAGRQSVSDFLTNLKIPAPLRAQAACLCDDEGIVYLAPLRIDERVKVTATTRRVLVVSVSGPWIAGAD